MIRIFQEMIFHVDFEVLFLFIDQLAISEFQSLKRHLPPSVAGESNKQFLSVFTILNYVYVRVYRAQNI